MENKAFVIGCGPAGMSASIALARLGFSVTIFEQRKEWSNRVCGEFLSPEASTHLEWFGLLDSVREQSVEVRTASLYNTDGSHLVMPIQRKGHHGMAVPRKHLEGALLEKALQSGVSIRMGTRISQALSDGNKKWTVTARNILENETERLVSDVLISADGRFSTNNRSVVKSLGTLGRTGLKTGWYGFNALFRGLKTDRGELALHFFPQGYLGHITFRDGTSNVSCAVHRNIKDEWGTGWNGIYLNILEKRAYLKNIFQNAGPISSWTGVGPMSYGSRLKTPDGPIPVGDAAGICDPFMGEGVARALGAGPLLYRAYHGLKSAVKTQSELQKGYSQLWKKEYSGRQNLGHLLRFFLKSQKSLSFFHRFISKFSPIQRYILSQTHG